METTIIQTNKSFKFKEKFEFFLNDETLKLQDSKNDSLGIIDDDLINKSDLIF